MVLPIMQLVLVSASAIAIGCRNDTDCIGHEAWQCVHSTAADASPCQVNGWQSPTPPYAWPWTTCACRASKPFCDSPTPAPPPSVGFGCRSGRCMKVLKNGAENSSQSCEWETGCVPLLPHEWLAYTASWKLENSSGQVTLTSGVDFNYIKKSQEPSSTLPIDEKMLVLRNSIVQLSSYPLPAEDGYWVVACAPGSVCGATGGLAKTPSPKIVSIPKVLLIGDSIKQGYFPKVSEALSGQAALASSHGNAGNADNLLHNLECYLQQSGGPRWDVVTFNAGIHELAGGQEWLALDAYVEMIGGIARRLREVRNEAGGRAKVLFLTTTPMATNATDAAMPANPEGILDADVKRYNAAAVAAVQATGASVLDLHAVVSEACGGDGYTACALQKANNPHFLEPGWELLGSAVAQRISDLLAARGIVV